MVESVVLFFEAYPLSKTNMVYNRFVRALLFMFSMWRMARVRSSMLMGSSCASRTRSFSTSKATLAMAVGELDPLPLLPYFSRSALRLGRGIFDPSMAMICLPHTPINQAWKSRDSLQQRKSSIRSRKPTLGSDPNVVFMQW